LLVVASTYPRWGGDHEPGFVHDLVRQLVQSFDVKVVSPHAPGAVTAEVLDGADVRRYRYAPVGLETLVSDGGMLANLRRTRWKWLLVPGFLASQLAMLLRLHRAWKPDAIHAHWLLPQGLVAALALRLLRARTPLLLTSHGTDLHALRSPAMLALKRFALRRTSAVTVVSTPMQEELRRLGVAGINSAVMPMGVDLSERFTPDATGWRSSDELLFVGRLAETKGLRHLLAAMPAVLSAHPSVSLTVVGHGPELEARRAQVAALGIADKVLFEGALPQRALPRLYRRAAALVAPFEEGPSGAREGLGLVMVEAVGCGCPVITTRQPATQDVFGTAGPAGLAEPADPRSLAEEIIRVLSDLGGARRSTMQLRPVVVEKFGMGRVAGRYATVIGDLIRASGGGSPGP
jgi:glycosyltransferase involved in cell wall biosynthesis